MQIGGSGNRSPDTSHRSKRVPLITNGASKDPLTANCRKRPEALGALPGSRLAVLADGATSGRPPGIAVADRTQIFEREHKGRIEIESDEGHGSTFRVVLPAAESAG